LGFEEVDRIVCFIKELGGSQKSLPDRGDQDVRG
jgi:hypothetical protein